MITKRRNSNVFEQVWIGLNHDWTTATRVRLSRGAKIIEKRVA